MDNEIINKELNKELNKEQLKERDLNQEKNEFDTDLKQSGELHKTEKEIIQTEQEVPAEQLKRSKLSKEEDGFIQKKDEFDLSQLGLGLDLSNFKIDCSEASMREAVRTALHEYLEIRKKVLEGKDENELTDGERAEFGEAYERLVRNVDDYVAMHGEQAKHGKAQKQLKRMARIRELIHIDNRFFMLSKSRRKMMDSMDADNEDTTGFPTLLKAVHYADNISNRNRFYKDNRKKQKEAGKLPELSQRSKEWWKTAMKNNWDRTKAAYNVTGGLIDRTIGIGTMIASNTLILGGKIVKLPIKLLSMAFNKLSKKYKSQKRWTVDYSITKGWAGLTEGRQIFRDCAKGLAALPVGVYDSLVHGFPYLFRKMAGKSKENDKVYRTSGRLFKGIGERIAGIIYSLGFNKNYIDLNKPDDAITDSSKEKDKSLLKTDEKKEEEKKEDNKEDKKEEEKEEDKKEDNKEENKEEKKEDNKEEKEEKIDEEQINSEFDDILVNFKDEDEEEQSEGDKTSEKKEDNKEEKEEKIDEEQINSEFDDILVNFKDEDKEEANVDKEKNKDKKDEKEKDSGWAVYEQAEGELKAKEYKAEEFSEILKKTAVKEIKVLNNFVLSPAEAGKLNKEVDIYRMFATGKNNIKFRKMSDEFMAFKSEHDVENVAVGENGEIKGGGLKINGLAVNRIKAAIMGKFGIGKTDEEWLTILNRLDAIENMKKNNLTADVANAQFDESVKELKKHYYHHLKRLEATYGKKLTQMHPYDVFRMIGDRFPEVMDEFSIMQDLTQLIDDGKKYFDPKSKEDQDFINLAYYYNNVYTGVLARYAAISQANPDTNEIDKFSEYNQKRLSVANEGYTQAFNYVKEDVVNGPSLTPEEQKKYIKDLRKRAEKEGWKDRLFGRYSKKYAGKELNEAEIVAREQMRIKEENAEFRMKMPFKHFNFSLDMIKNLKGAPDYLSIVHSGNNKETARSGLKALHAQLQDNRTVANVDKSVVVTGMITKRVATNLMNSAGEGLSVNDALSILKRLDAKGNMEANKLSKKEADKQFLDAFSELKEIYYIHLKRLENNYGKLFSQIHPYDMLRIMGGDYYKLQADFLILQDAIEMTRCKKPYFDRENEKDKEFEKLVCYYSNAYTGVLQAFGAHGASGTEITDEDLQNMANANEKGVKTIGFVTDKDIKGVSLTREEQKAYIKDVRRRARAEGWDDKLFGRFKDPNVMPVNRNILSTPKLKVPESLEKAYTALDEKYKNTGISKAEMTKMRGITKSSYEFNKGIKYAIPKQYYEYLKINKRVGQDPLGRLCLMRPVKVNADGNPINETEAYKLNANMSECYSLMKEDLKERKPFLDRVINDAKEMIFSIEELKDAKFIVKNRDRAIRHLAFMNNLAALYDSHAKYYLQDESVNDADRAFMFMLVKGTDYISYSAEKIHQALFGNGLDHSYVGEKDLPDEILKKTNKKVRKVEELGTGEKAIYKSAMQISEGDVDPDYTEGIISHYLTPYKKKPSAAVLNMARSGMKTYMETEKDKIKNVVEYKPEPVIKENEKNV